MSYEAEIAAILDADATLDALLTGGIHTSVSAGPMGISRDTTPGAFDANGYLKPTALVNQRDKVPTGDVLDYETQAESFRQIVQIWLYNDSGSGYATLDTAAARIRTLLMGETLTDSFELRLALWMDRQRDDGALAGAAMERVDIQVDFVLS